MYKVCSGLIIILLISINACGADVRSEVYLNAHHGFSVTVPANWTRSDDKGDECLAVFTLPETGAATFSGVALETGVDLAWFEKQYSHRPNVELITNLFGFESYKKLNAIDASVAGLKARLIEFTARIKGVEYNGCYYLATGNGRGFCLLCQAEPNNYARVKDSFVRVVQTFKVTKSDGKTKSEYSHTHHGYRLKYPATWHIIPLKDNWTAIIEPQNAGEELSANILINTAVDPTIGLAVEHAQFVQQAFRELTQKPGVSNGEAPKIAKMGNMQGFRYAVTHVSPNKILVNQECYSAMKGPRHFIAICSAPSKQFAATRAVFDDVIKSIHTDDRPVQIIEHRSKRNGFLIKYPEDWLSTEPMPSALGLVYPKKVPGSDYLFEAMGSISSDSADSNTDLERVEAHEKKNDARELSHRLEEEKSVKLNGLNARRHICALTVDKVKMKTLRYIVLGRHRQYVFEFVSPEEKFSNYLNSFEQIAHSFKLLPVPNNVETYYMRRVRASLRFPAHWKVWEDSKTDRATIMLIRDKPKQEDSPDVLVSVDLRQEKVPRGTSLQAITKATVEQVTKEQTKAKIVKQTELKIDGHDAIETQLSAGTPQEIRNLTCYTVLAHEMSYVITKFGTKPDYDLHAMAMDSIVRSIQFDTPTAEFNPVVKNETDEVAKELHLFNGAYYAIRDYLKDGEILIPPNILARAELGDHFETINLDRPDRGNAFGNPSSHRFTLVRGDDQPESEGGTYGHPEGGGRKLMVPKRCCDLSQAIVKCFRHGYTAKNNLKVSDEQTREVVKHIDMLASSDTKKQEAATASLLKTGGLAANFLIDTLNESKKPEIHDRVLRLLQIIQLRAVVDKFRLDHPVK